jgi:phage RecT family recombinase
MPDNFLTLLEKRKPDISSLLAEWITPQRFFSMAMQIQRNPALKNCTAESLVECVIQAAQMGLEIGGSKGHFYAVPYGNDAVGQPGWRGLAFLRLKAGAIMRLDTEVVFKGEVFKIARGTDGDKFLHELDYTLDRREPNAVAAYARVILPTGEEQFEVTSRDRVLRHKAHSKQPNGLLWKEFWEEGWRKTPYRILDKRLPEGVNEEAMERHARAISIDRGYEETETSPEDNLPGGPVAGVAQTVEQDTRNVQVAGSTPAASSKLILQPEVEPSTLNDAQQVELRAQWKAMHGKISGFQDWLRDNYNVTDPEELFTTQLAEVAQKMATIRN